ncbi:hypothetical protein [Cyclobacterium plantarum]|uniref:Uncharacterized protein n=1 Tax=Cyclobacterium plantarum TaxID=2716263 RepID=A0ABX0HA25_9BACT|nr:hypothetical protein [Cyclobacterium plantarum]NHE58482.1 hypothetical protein [Cyclobacterium plantarum]
MKNPFVIFLFIILPYMVTYGQQKVVNYNIDTGTFTDELPFDERFTIAFTSTNEISSLEIKYKIQNYDVKKLEKNPKKYYFQDPTLVDDDGFITVTRRAINSKTFSIGNIGPIHANTPYTFNFKGFEKIVLNEDEEKRLKNDIKNFLENIYLGDKQIPDFEIVLTEFNNILKKYVEDDIFESNRKKVTELDLLASLSVQIRELRNLQNKRIYLEESNVAIVGSIIKSLPIVCFEFNSINLDDNNWKALNGNINKNIEKFKDVTIRDFISFLKEDCNDFIQTEKLILGENSLVLNSGKLKIIDTEKFDNIETLNFISSGFKALFELRKPDQSPEYYFREGSRNLFENLIHEFDYNIESGYEKDGLTAISEKMLSLNNKAISEIPNILANKYTEVMLSQIEYYSFTDVQSQSTPYVNVDLGILYADELNTPFILETINFHFSPINRDALLSDIKGFWNHLEKRLSFQVGLAQRLGPTDETFENYLAGALGTPYVGLGFRANRILRISTGAIFYQQSNLNPVVDSKYTKSSFVFSVSINSALSNALGGLNSLVNNDGK